MKAPDKIYVGIQDLGSGYATSVSIKPQEGHSEYIRSEALMEMLLTMEARHSVFYLEGKIVREIIEKINSI